MIAKLQIKTQYGGQGTTGINLLSELDEEITEAFAHGVQDALEWCKSYPLYQDAIIDNLADGRFVVSSQWKPRDKSMDGLFDYDDGMDKADFTRSQVFILPVNTVYENTGFAGGNRS